MDLDEELRKTVAKNAEYILALLEMQSQAIQILDSQIKYLKLEKKELEDVIRELQGRSESG